MGQWTAIGEYSLGIQLYLNVYIIYKLEVCSDPSGLFSPSRGCSSLPSCASCGEEAHATHFCPDCKDLLCIVCVEAHQRVRVTRDHKVIPLTSTVPQAVLPHFLMVSILSFNDDNMLIVGWT